jgi:hypothetical protein
VNRKSTDGTVISVRKDGSTVGSIGVATRPYFASPDWGLKIGQSGAQGYLEPTNQNGTALDAGINIGASGTRWKNLYLSGGVYLGGTGSANYLDDYETGTFTPTISFGGASVGVTYSNQQGYYIKVGKLVYVTMYIRLNNKGSSTGDAYIEGLPFTVGNGLSSTSIEGGGVFTYFAQVAANISGLVISGQDSSTTAAIRYLPASGTISPNATDSLFNNTFDSRISLTYNST